MSKVIKATSSCVNCTHSVLFVSAEADFTILACRKNEKAIQVVHRGGIFDCEIPDDCPLPDFVEPQNV